MFKVLFFLYTVTLVCNGFIPQYLSLHYNQTYNFNVNASTEYILQFSAIQEKCPPRVTITSEKAEIAWPLMVVARQPIDLLSWQLPLILEGDLGKSNFTTTSRTLCHDMYRHYATEIVQYPILGVSTASAENVSFTVRVDYEADFFIVPSVEHKFVISPSQPKYYFYNFTTNGTESAESNWDTVILEVNSNDTVCITVSIQNATCPVFDTNEDITFRGFYGTVYTRGGITIPKYKFPKGFFAVFVAKSDDFDCVGKTGTSTTNRTKTISMIIKPSIKYQDYINAVVAVLSSIGSFYFIFIVGFLYCSRRNQIPRQMEYVSSESTTPSTTCAEVLDDVSFDDSEYDIVSEAATDKALRLSKSVLYLTDLARKDPRIHKYKSYLYLYNVLTVSLFYGLPVIQLVITYQRVLNQTGEQDLCYYNFFCSHPLGVISDFNHVFSNIGYISLGLLFLAITHRRETTHKDLDFDRQYGIPQHYGMFYAMAVALIMEGILSGSYHVCPNQANFQFDTSFMYVMAVLCMVKLYQNRHPDINATAYATFGVLAITILFGMIGILEGNLIFWVIFTIIHLLSCLFLSIQIYYMGCWSFDKGLAVRAWRICVYEFWAGPLNVIRPIHKARMSLLIVGNLCNWGLTFWGLYRHENDFALFLLAVFLGNTGLYFIFYIIMKYINGERLSHLSWFFLFISTLCAISAMYFFLHKSISWATTPAQSKHFNQECKLLHFFDYHDIWHFLSAIGMFFSFMILLTMDDDLSHTHRARIVVF